MEDFWGVINNIPPPAALPAGSNYYFFKEECYPEMENEVSDQVAAFSREQCVCGRVHPHESASTLCCTFFYHTTSPDFVLFGATSVNVMCFGRTHTHKANKDGGKWQVITGTKTGPRERLNDMFLNIVRDRDPNESHLHLHSHSLAHL